MTKTIKEIKAEHPELLIPPSEELEKRFAREIANHYAQYPVGKTRHVHLVQQVYFIKCGNCVKIGIANIPQQRLDALSTGSSNKLELLGTCPGGRELERQLHQRFSSVHKQGEWFYLTQEILDTISELTHD